MARAVVEFLVEPFREADPGPHVLAARAAARAMGFEVHDGPFGSSFSVVAGGAGAALGAVIDAALGQGATRVSLQVTVEP